MGMVNTFGHRAGSRPHPDFPGYDSAWLSVLLLGHGYHNSHHAHPAAARTGFLDPMWPILRLLSGLGLITIEEQRAQTQPRACCTAFAFMAPVRATVADHIDPPEPSRLEPIGFVGRRGTDRAAEAPVPATVAGKR